MKILEWGEFVADYKPINLYIKGRAPIIISSEKSKEKELLVRSIIKQIYPNFSENNDFSVGGRLVSGELLNKAQKNIAILYEIVDIAKVEGIKIWTADDLISFIRERGSDLFHPNGKFFDRIYKRLGGATELGKGKESISNDFFKSYADSKGISIEIKTPEDYKEDVLGTDAYFELDGKRYTIQTKTLRSIKGYGDFYRVYITGYFSEIKTHYLVLIPRGELGQKYIFKGKRAITKVDSSGVNYYYIPKEDLIHVG